MWTMVHFPNDNAVEAVPSHWVKKNICAWPKKDVKKHILQRSVVNKFDFVTFPSKTLKKDIGN